MTTYIGPLGGLVAIECPSSLRAASERPASTRVTTSGVVRQQVSRRASREWDVQWGAARPEQIANLAAIVAGEFGLGPFWFVDPWAQVTNLLAPRASMLEGEPPAGMSLGGPVNLADGSRAGRSWVVANPATVHHVNYLDGVLHRIPVRNGQTATGTVHASGAGSVDLRLQWYDAASNFLSNTAWTSHTPGSAVTRLHVYGNPPVGAHSASVQVRGANRITRPALTWTSFVAEWHVGQGAPSVAIPATLAQDIILATREARSHGRMASVSTTIREVG